MPLARPSQLKAAVCAIACVLVLSLIPTVASAVPARDPVAPPTTPIEEHYSTSYGDRDHASYGKAIEVPAPATPDGGSGAMLPLILGGVFVVAVTGLGIRRVRVRRRPTHATA